MTFCFVSNKVFAKSILEHVSHSHPLEVRGDWCFPPFEYTNEDGAPAGYNVDLLEALMREMKVPYHLELTRFSSAMNDVRTGRADLLCMMYSEQRAKQFKFSKTVFRFVYQDIIYRKNSRPIHYLSELRKLRVMVEDKAIAHDVLRKEGFDSTHLILFPSVDETIMELSKGHFDAVVCDEDAAREIISDNGITNLNIITTDIAPREYRFASRDSAFLARVDLAYSVLKKNGTIDRLQKKWFEKEEVVFRLPHYVYLIVIALLLIAILLYIFNHTLRNRVEKVKKQLMAENRKLSLAIHAGGLEVWGYNIAENFYYNIAGNLLPDYMSEQLVASMFHPVDYPRFAAIIKEMKEGKMNTAKDCFRFRYSSDEKWKYIEKEFMLVRSEAGIPQMVIGTHKDVTDSIMEQQREAELLRKYRTVFDSALVGLCYFDRDGILTDINGVTCDIFGIGDVRQLLDLKPSIYRNKYLYGILSEDNMKPYRGVIEYEPGNITDNVKIKKCFTRKGVMYLEVSVNPIFGDDHQMSCIIVSIIDVTERRVMQRKLEETAREVDFAIKSSDLVLWEMDLKRGLLLSYKEPLANYEDAIVSDNETWIQQLVHPDDRAIARKAIHEYNSGMKRPLSYEIRIKYPDDKWHHCTVVGDIFERDHKTGAVTRVVGFRKDNTHIFELNKKIYEYTEKMKYVMKTVKMNFFTYDIASQKIAFATDPNKVDLEMSVEDFICGVPEEERERISECLSRMNNREMSVFSFRRTATDDKGDKRYIDISAVPVYNEDERITSYFGLRRDITDLMEIQHHLEEETKKARQADMLKSAFLANMSHEIRTPLNAIVGFSDLLLYAETQEEREKFAGIIHSNNELLLSLISDVLDLSKIESGYLVFNREKIDLVPFFHNIAESLRQRVSNPKVEFIVDCPYDTCMVTIDSKRFAQLMTNFTTNAIKHTSKGHIRLGLKCGKETLLLFVEDTGSGIPKDQQLRVFERFVKLNDFVQGTGLGLSICKAIVENSHGRIWVESQEGKGSTFYAEILCTAVVTEAEEKGGETLSPVVKGTQPVAMLAADGGKRPEVLLAEDDDSNYILTQYMLEKHYHLTRALNGRIAVDLASEKTYDIILMDLKMPVMNGLEAISRIRQFDKDIPIVVLTANIFDSDKEKAEAAGSNAFLIKPLNKELLWETIERLRKKS